MPNQTELATTFKNLHVAGSPVILYNIWDAGSAKAVADSGAKAIASGSHGVANAFGFEDGELIPLELAIDNAKRIVAAVDLPVTMDLETGYGQTPDEVKSSAAKVIAAGIVGVNIEDQLFNQADLRPLHEQVERLEAVRAAANEAGVPLVINARTDMFKNANPDQHSNLIYDALVRAEAYKAAGADSFFVPGLKDINLITDLCARSPLPVNIIWLDGMVPESDIANAGAARISYGPGPYLKMIEWLKTGASKALQA